MPNILILSGGPSHEREISLKTGQTFQHALKDIGFNVRVLEMGHSWQQDILAARPDFALLALHGCPGEDGVVQQFLEHYNIPYQGSDSAASDILMDKSKTKALFHNANLPVTPSAYITHSSSNCPFDFPVFVKPVNGGSSLGCHAVHSATEWHNALTDALIYDNKILVEPLLTGTEYTVAMWNDEPIAAIQITPEGGGTFGYDAKYNATNTDYTFLAAEDALTQELFALSQKAVQISGAKHMTRVDFMADADGKLYILEINTLPGMSVLYPRALAATGRSLSDLLYAILQEANIIQKAA